MKSVAKARATRDEIAFAMRLLEQLSRHIDNEAEQSIIRTRQWYLENGRVDWIATQALQRMQSVDMVIRDLTQWAFALENSPRSEVHENSLGKN